MFIRSLFGQRKAINIITHRYRSLSSRTDEESHVYRYFARAKLIDKIRVCLRSGRPDSLVHILKNRDLDAFVVNNAIRSAPSPDIALSFAESLESVPYFQHTQQTLNAIAKVLAKAGRSAQLRTLLDAIKDNKFPNVRPFSIVDCMRLYAIAGDLDSVVRVEDEFRLQGKRPCIEAYNVVMGLYVEMGKDLEAVETFRKMMKASVIPNARTFTIVIEHLVNSGSVEKGKEVFDMLPLMGVKHTTMQYSVLVETFLNLEQYDVVKSLLRGMKTEGIFPPRYLLKSLQCAFEAGLLDGIDDFIEEMKPDDRIKKIKSLEYDEDDEKEEDVDEGIKLKPWLDPSALASALHYWTPEDVLALEDAKIVWTSRIVCKMIRDFKSSQTAWKFFCWVTDQPGFIHDVHTYSGAITKLSSDGMVNLVDELLLKVKSEGIKLPIVTVKQVIDSYGLSKEGDAALRVLHDVEALCDSINDSEMVLLYSSLLQTLIKCGRDGDSVNVVKQMFSAGIHPDSQTFSSLMHRLAVEGNIKTVHSLSALSRQCSVQSDAFIHKTLIHAYCKSGRATLALRYFEDMINADVMPDGETKSLLVKCLWKEGKLKEAYVVEGSCKETSDVIPRPSSSRLFNIKAADLLRVQKLYCDSFEDKEIPT